MAYLPAPEGHSVIAANSAQRVIPESIGPDVDVARPFQRAAILGDLYLGKQIGVTQFSQAAQPVDRFGEIHCTDCAVMPCQANRVILNTPSDST